METATAASGGVVITYRLALVITDGDDEKTIYRDTASLDVRDLFAIDDREAFDQLAGIIRGALVPEGSTVVEKDALRVSQCVKANVFDEHPLRIGNSMPPPVGE